MIHLILFLIIIILWPSPLRWEIKNDAYGERKKHPNYDWQRRTVLCILAGLANAVFLNIIYEYGWWWVIWNAVRYSVCTAGIFIAIFPYAINYVQLKNHVTRANTSSGYLEYQFLQIREIITHILTHLSDTAIPDKYDWYRKLGPALRLAGYGIILIVSITIWFL